MQLDSRLTWHLQAGQLLADSALNDDTMALLLSELITCFKQSDRGWSLNHILHLTEIQIVNPFDVKSNQLDWALTEAMRELETVGDDLTSMGNTEDGDEAEEHGSEREEEEVRQFRNIAMDLVSKLSTDKCASLATVCIPGATALSKVHILDPIVFFNG